MPNLNIIEQLANNNYIAVNKTLIKKFGLTEAILIGELCSEYNYWKKCGELTNDMFYSTATNIEENTGLSPYQQRKAFKHLEEIGVIRTELAGIPAQKYFVIDEDKLLKNLISSCEETSQQEVKKLHSNNNNKNNKENKTITINSNSTNFSFGTKQSKPKKESMYSKCVSLIVDFTDDSILRELLVSSLNLFLENSRESDKPFYTNHFKGKLNDLKKLSEDNHEQRKIVQQTLDKGWNGFYAVKTDKRKRTGNFAKDVENLNGGLNQRAKRGDNSGEKF